MTSPCFSFGVFAPSPSPVSLSCSPCPPPTPGPTTAARARTDTPAPPPAPEVERIRKREVEDRDPLLGLSSPIVLDNQVWLTTATEDGHDLYVLCLDATTGKILANEKLSSTRRSPVDGQRRGRQQLRHPLRRHRTRTRLLALRPLRHRLSRHATRQVLWKRDDLKCWHYRGAPPPRPYCLKTSSSSPRRGRPPVCRRPRQDHRKTV